MHYFLIAIAENTDEGIHKLLDFIESKYVEREIEEHDEVCWCAHHIGEDLAREYAEKKLGKTRSQLSEEYDERKKTTDEWQRNMKRWEEMETYNAPDKEEKWNKLLEDMSAHLGRESNLWELTVKRPIKVLENEFLSTYKFDRAEPDCEECGGTGKVQTTYTRDGEYDGWRVGGRWCGAIHGGEFLSGVNWGPAFEGIEENAVMVEDIKDNVIPFAMITPKNEWLIKNEIDWVSILGKERYLTDPDAEDNGWKEIVQSIFREYSNKNHIAIGIDIHH